MADKAQLQADLRANHGHVPVMRARVTQLLAEAVTAAGEHAVIIDGTLGAGGHSEYFLTQFPLATVIGLDRDTHALGQARARLEKFGDRFVGLHCRFDQYLPVLEQTAAAGNQACQRYLDYGLTGALFDLGVSSMQLDQPERGFAYSIDAPLDMRMNDAEGLTAADILNTYSHGELAKVLKNYGDERFAGKIASAVIKEREREPFTTSQRFVELLYATIPAAARRTGGHPAKRSFQALRIEVNRELEAIEQVVPRIADALHPGGRAVFMAYQSLEDKIVKRIFADLTTSKTPPGLPVDLPEFAAKFSLVTRGAEKATEDEIAENPRSASVRVRAIEAKKVAQ
ncbi:16S rRNA (cytosine(1402)-N(4))-methyltransferase RsmH [Corynebacterium sp. HS2168-gen11]|uniref:16S rRNA (cytosine(1402)-N(4))-methyltransferase RsmH n=1 Tax=Corynebacterium sp. HS2168-gen11 TaxID=2974027 RepID=UPI0037BFCD9B